MPAPRWTQQDIANALNTVIVDQRRSYPDMSPGEAIAHALNTVDPKNIDGDIAYEILFEIFSY